MAEFEEIAHAGGRLTFIYDAATGISIEFQHGSPFPVTVFQVCIKLDGSIVDYVATSGEGGESFYPQPSVLAPLLSDREGLFGQKCKSCGSYFRTSILSRLTTCPYCGFRQHGASFLTENQLQYLTKFFNTYVETQQRAETRVVDLDAMIDGLVGNAESWVYKEERQQTRSRCASCGCVYDVLGKYALCPACATPNYARSFQNALEELQGRLKAGADASDVPGELFSRIFSEYEALANAIRTQMLRLPATERRRHQIEKMSFQRLDDAAELLEQYFAIQVYDGLSKDDISFLTKMINRRHILVHNAGRVDEHYLRATADTTVRLNEVIRVNLADTTRTIGAVKGCADNLIQGWQSIR